MPKTVLLSVKLISKYNNLHPASRGFFSGLPWASASHEIYRESEPAIQGVITLLGKKMAMSSISQIH